MTDIDTVDDLDSIDLEDEKTRKKYQAQTNVSILNEFVLQQDQIIKKSLFPFSIFRYDNKIIGAFGLFLIKQSDILNREGQKVGIEQKKFPVLICSDGVIREIRASFSEIYKVCFEVPDADNYPARWSYDSIIEWLRNESKMVLGFRLFEKIKAQYKKYLYFASEEWYSVHALWDMGTYFFLLFKYYPIFELRGVQGSAKSKIMTISRGMTFNASEELTNPTESTLFRDTHSNRPTLYIDEAEKLFRINKGVLEPDQRAEVINSGYKWTGKVPRQEAFGRKFKTIYYDTYCPKMVASINGLYGATEDRAITHITTRAPKDDGRSEKEPEENEPIWQEIRDDLYIFALQNWASIKQLYDQFNDKLSLKSRDYWIWKPILILAKYLDASLYKEVSVFAGKNSNIKKIDTIPEGSTEHNILKAILEVMQDKDGTDNRILAQEIADKLPAEYKPSNRTICRHVDAFGFKDYKFHSEKGNGYQISKELFLNIISPLLPSLSSECSASDENIVSKPEDSMKIMKIEAEHNEHNEQNEDVFAPYRLNEALQKLIDYIKKLPSQTVPIEQLLEFGYPESLIRNWIETGYLFESPKGFIRVV